VSDEERRRGFDDLTKGLEAVRQDMQRTQEAVKTSRQQHEELTKAIQAHESNTAVTGQKVDTVVIAVTRIEDKMDVMSEKVVEAVTHGRDTREGLSRTRKDLALMKELVLRHDERITGSRLNLGEHKLLLIPGVGAILIFIGYYIDKAAANATLAAIKGWF